VLHAHTGEYLTLAREWHGTWYIGSITNWAPRDVTLQLDFLEEGKEYSLHAFGDGLNADKRAIDYQEVRRRVHRGDSVSVHLAPGGGWVGSLQAVKGTRP
jgi:alpha-glucosidase